MSERRLIVAGRGIGSVLAMIGAAFDLAEAGRRTDIAVEDAPEPRPTIILAPVSRQVRRQQERAQRKHR
jgi:hypothetical protein